MGKKKKNKAKKQQTNKSIQIFTAQSTMWVLYELNISLCGNVDSNRVNKVSLLNNSWKSRIMRKGASCDGDTAVLVPQFSANAEKVGQTFDGLGQVHLWAEKRLGRPSEPASVMDS